MDWHKIYKEYNFIKSQNDQEITKFMINNMTKCSGFFLNRIGGSDYDAIYDYISCDRDMSKYDINYHYNIVAQFNGYFDKSTNPESIKDNFKKYLEKMLESYLASDSYMNAVNTIQKSFATPKNAFNKSICRNKPIFHYYYIDSVFPFLNDFKLFAENKKILIVSPFSETIRYQTQPNRINSLIIAYKYPKFELLTYDVPITYNNQNDKLDHVETDNWLQQCEKMENDLSQLDFDIALLACASYATCLGSFISSKMNKKAIYIGGVLNILFNIKGGRYENDDFYNKINDLSYRVTAFELDKYKNIKGGRSQKKEAFNAYF